MGHLPVYQSTSKNEETSKRRGLFSTFFKPKTVLVEMGRRTGLVAEAKEAQFKRELRIRAIAGTNRQDAAKKAAAAVAPVTLAEKRAAREAASGCSPKEVKDPNVKEPPKTVFDTDATLHITVKAAREVANEQIERNSKPGAKAALAALTEANATLMAALAVKRAASGGLGDAPAATKTNDDDQAPSARKPESHEELEQELMWLRRKQTLARDDCRRAEALLYAKAEEQHRPLTLEEKTADEALSNARRRYNKYSRRLT